MRTFFRTRTATALSSCAASAPLGASGCSSLLTSSSAILAGPSTVSTPLVTARRHQWGTSSSGSDFGNLDSEIDAMFGKAMDVSAANDYEDGWSVMPGQQGGAAGVGAAADGVGAPVRARPPPEMSAICKFERQDKIPAKFDVLSFSSCFAWRTNAKTARKIVGPMREWANEVKHRTGVHIEADVTFPNKVAQRMYSSVDDVEVTLYAFGTERSIAYTSKFLENVLTNDPSYVRIGVFRRVPDTKEVEWLTLRRINSEYRPPDVPPISLKLTGKHTLLFEGYKDAAIRSVWEETGIALDPKLVFPSGMLDPIELDYFWRVPVRYFVAECPEGTDIRGPLPSQSNYLQAWDSRILKQSPDPIDQAWAKLADPSTGTAWIRTSQLNELQKPLRGDHYMSIRYTPPPFSNLQEVVNLPPIGAPSS